VIGRQKEKFRDQIAAGRFQEHVYLSAKIAALFSDKTQLLLTADS
jgi:hypothetical protein